MGATVGRGGRHATAAVVYLALAIGLWSGVWFRHPTGNATCGCGDTSMLTWAMSWPAYALTHGQSLLFSTRIPYPYGMNLLANTSVLALGVPLAPVTLLFGPVAALNVAATLAPVVSALAARAVALRWTTWPPAALVAGLAYGFSPYVLEGLTLEHIDWVTLVIPPLVLLCLDEILVTQRRRAWLAGASLGALAAVQFFLSPEVLVMAALAAGLGTAVLVIGALVVDRASVGRHWRHAAVGLATAALTAGALLAYPVWYALAGPRHLPGKVWPNQQLFGNSWQSVLLPAGPHDRGPNPILEAYGSFGPHPLLRGYLGIALACVLVAGLVRFRTEIRLWFLVSLLVMFEVLALGASAGPWRLFENLPVVENVVPGRLPAVADLFAALALGLVVDRARGAAVARRSRDARRRWVGAAVGLGLAVVALAPVAWYDGRPLTVRPVEVPTWFATAATRLPPSAVVLTYPYPSSGLQAPMTWQALDGLRFALVGGGGVTLTPSSRPTADQRDDEAAAADLASLSYGWLPTPPATARELDRLRRALSDWGVTTVVVPSEDGTPSALRARSVPEAVATFTAVLGTGPVRQDDAWVWSVRPDRSGPLRVPADAPARCGSSPAAATDPGLAARCVQASATGRVAASGPARDMTTSPRAVTVPGRTPPEGTTTRPAESSEPTGPTDRSAAWLAGRRRAHLVVLVAAYALSRIVAAAIGVRYDDSVLSGTRLTDMWQLLDVRILRGDLVEGVWHLNMQPPLLNLEAGLLLKLPGGRGGPPRWPSPWCSESSWCSPPTCCSSSWTCRPGSPWR